MENTIDYMQAVHEYDESRDRKQEDMPVSDWYIGMGPLDKLKEVIDHCNDDSKMARRRPRKRLFFLPFFPGTSAPLSFRKNRFKIHCAFLVEIDPIALSRGWELFHSHPCGRGEWA